MFIKNGVELLVREYEIYVECKRLIYKFYYNLFQFHGKCTHCSVSRLKNNQARSQNNKKTLEGSSGTRKRTIAKKSSHVKKERCLRVISSFPARSREEYVRVSVHSRIDTERTERDYDSIEEFHRGRQYKTLNAVTRTFSLGVSFCLVHEATLGGKGTLSLQ